MGGLRYKPFEFPLKYKHPSNSGQLLNSERARLYGGASAAQGMPGLNFLRNGSLKKLQGYGGGSTGKINISEL